MRRLEKRILVPLPSLGARLAMFSSLLAGRLAAGVTPDTLAEKTEGYRQASFMHGSRACTYAIMLCSVDASLPVTGPLHAVASATACPCLWCLSPFKPDSQHTRFKAMHLLLWRTGIHPIAV